MRLNRGGDDDAIRHELGARSRIDNAISRALFPPGDDEIHYAVGVVFGLQIDLGADFADPHDTSELSAIYSF